MSQSWSARIFVALIAVLGFLFVAEAIRNTRSLPTVRFTAFLVLATVAARFKVKMPGLSGSMAVNLPFILLAAALMETSEAAMVAFISTFAQGLPRGKHRLNPVQLVFNCCAITLSASAARFIYATPHGPALAGSPALRLAAAAAGYFLVNTVTVAVVISLTEKASPLRIWAEMFQLSYPYLVASAGVAGLALTAGRGIAWQVPLMILPVMIGVFYSYRRYFDSIATAPLTGSEMEAAGVAAGARI